MQKMLVEITINEEVKKLINKWNKMKCDQCLFSEHYLGHATRETKEEARRYGWVFADEGDFCSITCFREFQSEQLSPKTLHDI